MLPGYTELLQSGQYIVAGEGSRKQGAYEGLKGESPGSVKCFI